MRRSSGWSLRGAFDLRLHGFGPRRHERVQPLSHPHRSFTVGITFEVFVVFRLGVSELTLALACEREELQRFARRVILGQR